MASEQHIMKILKEAEIKFQLRNGILCEIYNAETRVVHKGKRRNIRVDLRNIISQENTVDDEK